MNLSRDWTDRDCAEYRRIFVDAGASPLHGVAVGIVESNMTCDARNSRSSATGLPQLMGHGDPPIYLGKYTRDEFVALGLAGQLPIVADRYRRRAGKLPTLGHVYAVIAAPAAIDEDLAEDEPIYAETGTTKYGDKRDEWRKNPRWHLDGGPVTIASLGLSARVYASSARFHELTERITGAPVPWVDFWSREVRAEVAGLVTRSDVIAYQRGRGLVADGEVGPKTVAALVLDYDAGSLG